MSDTRIEKSQLMFPQSRNAHSNIFGGAGRKNHVNYSPALMFFVPFHVGYLMRLAYELGFANATLFCRRPVRFFSLDKIAFTKPVSIGSILRLRSTIIHSTASDKYPAIVVSRPSLFVDFRLNPWQHTRVEANVVDVSTGLEETTNDFRFTWTLDDGPPLSRNVVPKTYEGTLE